MFKNTIIVWVAFLAGIGAGFYLVNQVDNMLVRQDSVLDYDTLRTMKGLEWSGVGCGLSTYDACVALEYAYYDSLVYHPELPLKAVTASQNSLQPYGVGPEDDVRAMDVAQPTYLGVQVTQHGRLLQGSL